MLLKKEKIDKTSYSPNVSGFVIQFIVESLLRVSNIPIVLALLQNSLNQKLPLITNHVKHQHFIKKVARQNKDLWLMPYEYSKLSI